MIPAIPMDPPFPALGISARAPCGCMRCSGERQEHAEALSKAMAERDQAGAALVKALVLVKALAERNETGAALVKALAERDEAQRMVEELLAAASALLAAVPGP